MSIRRINVSRDNSAANVNPKFHNPDGTVIPHWREEVCKTPLSEYYLTPQVPEYVVMEHARARKTLPPGYVLVSDETTYEGRVIAITDKVERIMSDIWENVRYAEVLSPETIGQKNRNGVIQNSPYTTVTASSFGNYLSTSIVTVDCDPAIIAQWKQHCEEERQRMEKEQNERVQKAYRSEVAKDKIVCVNRGRKIPKGTTGKVFWIGNNGYGESVGIATTPRKGPKVGNNGRSYESFLDIVFVSRSNVDVVGSESEEALTAAQAAWLAKG